MLLSACDPLVEGIPSTSNTVPSQQKPEIIPSKQPEPDIIPSEQPEPDIITPEFDTSNLLSRNNRLLELEFIESINLSASIIGLQAVDDKDGNVSNKITYERVGFKQTTIGYYYFVRYDIEDSSGNSNSLEIPFSVIKNVQIDSSNFADYFELLFIYNWYNTYDGTLAYYVETFLTPQNNDIQISSSALYFISEINYTWKQRYRERDCRLNCVSSTRDGNRVQEIRTSIGSAYYNEAVPYFLKSESIELWGTSFRIASKYEYSSVSDSQVNKSTSFVISGSAIATIMLTDL